MNEFYNKVKILDEYTGIEDTFICLIILLLVVSGCFWFDSTKPTQSTEPASIEEEEKDPPRNFTSQQLLHFNGTKDTNEEEKPIYLSVHGRVFNVTKGRDFYGPGSPYENFAGHECGVAFAKFSFDTEFLDDVKGCDEKLNWFEKEELYNWIEKFSYYRNYPELGRLVPDEDLPDSERVISVEELNRNNGVDNIPKEKDEKDDENKEEKIPKGYATAPIYVALKHKVFDVSFGGVAMYGPGGPYEKFAGRDVSRALAKMSFAKEDLENTDISDLTEKQMKVLDDWIRTFEEKKMYPVVGRLE